MQETRLQQIHKRCLELNDSWKEPTWLQMVLNRRKRVVMCLVSKAASSTWLRVLLTLTGKPEAIKIARLNRHRVHGGSGAFLGRLHKFSPSLRAHYMMGHYYKAMFAREPMERLVSGYRDKMFRAWDYVWMRDHVKRLFRKNVSTRFVKSVFVDKCCNFERSKCCQPVSYTHLTLPTNREV